MTSPTPYHQIGSFIVSFQHAEAALSDLLKLLANADDEVVSILTNELEYSKRLKTTDVVFARFIDLRRTLAPEIKAELHSLVVELGKLGERRNEIVHSHYATWHDVNGAVGLLRENSKLRGADGIRRVEEEELHAEDFTPDLERIRSALIRLEKFRLRVIDWLCPEALSADELK